MHLLKIFWAWNLQKGEISGPGNHEKARETKFIYIHIQSQVDKLNIFLLVATCWHYCSLDPFFFIQNNYNYDPQLLQVLFRFVRFTDSSSVLENILIIASVISDLISWYFMTFLQHLLLMMLNFRLKLSKLYIFWNFNFYRAFHK